MFEYAAVCAQQNHAPAAEAAWTDVCLQYAVNAAWRGLLLVVFTVNGLAYISREL